MNKPTIPLSKFLKPTDTSYLVSLEIENVKCFKEKQTLRFANDQNRPYRWTVLLGDNGTGKTTVLRSIFKTIEKRYFYRSVPSNLGLLVDVSFDDKSLITTKTNFNNNIESVSFSFDPNNGFGLYATPDKTIQSEVAYQGNIVFGYGASRKNDWLFTPLALGELNNTEEYIAEGIKNELTSTLTNIFAKLKNLESYLLNLDYIRKTDRTKKSNIEFETIIQILKSVLPDVAGIRIRRADKNHFLEVEMPYGWINFRSLSLGYQTVAAWIGDLAIRLFEAYPNHKNPLAQPAVVMVDEIDLHLHPQWQLKIMDYLCERFPKTQFIVTAHSPLIVQSASDANVIMLERRGNQVVANTNTVSIKGWRIDQILGSDLFGSLDARSANVQEKIRRRKELTLKTRLTAQEKKELAQLDNEVEALPTAESPEMIQAMEFIRQAAHNLNTKK